MAFYVILNLVPIHYALEFCSCVGLFVFFGCYMTLTLEPPKTFIFKDPINGKYGFRAHINLFKHKKVSKYKNVNRQNGSTRKS